MTLSRERGSNACMGASLLFKKLDIAILIFLFVILKIFPKLWACFNLKLSWPRISDGTNVKKLKAVSINM